MILVVQLVCWFQGFLPGMVGPPTIVIYIYIYLFWDGKKHPTWTIECWFLLFPRALMGHLIWHHIPNLGVQSASKDDFKLMVVVLIFLISTQRWQGNTLQPRKLDLWPNQENKQHIIISRFLYLAKTPAQYYYGCRICLKINNFLHKINISGAQTRPYHIKLICKTSH